MMGLIILLDQKLHSANLFAGLMFLLSWWRRFLKLTYRGKNDLINYTEPLVIRFGCVDVFVARYHLYRVCLMVKPSMVDERSLSFSHVWVSLGNTIKISPLFLEVVWSLDYGLIEIEISAL